MEGVVKWLSFKRDFGFIRSGGKDYFVHISDVEGKSKLERGDKVSFEVKETPRGLKALKVKKI